MIGGVVVAGGTLAIASPIGFITLFGIATRNGIMLTTAISWRRGGGLRDAIVQASIERLSRF